MTTPTKVIDFPPEKFPITIETFHPITGEVVWTVTIEQPPKGKRVVIEVPPLKNLLGHPVSVRVKFADGTEDVIAAPGESTKVH